MEEEASTSTQHESLGALIPGEIFDSYEQFKLRLQEHKEATSTDYWVRDCRTLAKAAGNIPRSLKAHADLKYYYIKLNCKYGGQNFKSKSKNKRKFTGTFRQGCDAKILINLTDDCQHLHVKFIDNSHNHVCSKSMLRARPGTSPKVRRIEKDDKDDGLLRYSRNVVHDGYIYRSVKSSRNEKKLYLICIVARCTGRAYRLYGSDITVTKAHTHDPDCYALERLQFSDKLKQRAEKEAVPVRKIFEEENAKVPELEEEYDKWKKIMLDARNAAMPLPPKTLQEIGYALVSEEWYDRFGCNLEDPPRELFIGCVRGKNKEIAAVFASLYLCDLLNQPIEELHIDTSYKNMPSKPFDMKYLMSVHMVQASCSFGVIYALMSSRSMAACLAVLKFVKDEVIPDCLPLTVFTSFEAEMQIACREVFPEAEIEGSSFHFVKDVWDHSQTLNVQSLPNQDLTMNLVKSCMALHLLPPALMESGLNAIAAAIQRSQELGNTTLIDLIQHIRYSWLEAVGASEISSHEKPKRSSQNLQNFHQELDYMVAKKELTPYRFITILQQLEHAHRQDHEKLMRDELDTPLRHFSLSVEDPKVVQAMQELTDGKIGIMDFLATAAATVERVTLQPQTFDNAASLSDEERMEEAEEELEEDSEYDS